MASNTITTPAGQLPFEMSGASITAENRCNLATPLVFWRAEGSLIQLTAVSSVGFFTWNAQSFLERWTRRGLMAAMAVGRPFLYLANRVFATRVLHTVLRGVSRDRLDLLGEEYFEYTLKPSLNPAAVRLLGELRDDGSRMVLVSHGLDHIIRPLANHLAVKELLCNHLEFRDGLATGRLMDPVVRPRGPLARIVGENSDGRVSGKRLVRSLGFSSKEVLVNAIHPARRISPPLGPARAGVLISREERGPFSVRNTLRGKTVLLIGATGFIGKVWLGHILQDLPEIGRIYLLVRRNRAHTSVDRFRRIIEESPAFDVLAEKYGNNLEDFLTAHVEVVEGDLTRPDLGLAPDVAPKLGRTLDVIINSSGLTDFNPELRDAVAANLCSTANLVDFLRGCDHAALLHLSTCYVAGARDGRIPEQTEPNYTPLRVPGFSAEHEWQALEKMAEEIEAESLSPKVTEELRRQAVQKKTAAKNLHGAALENQIRKNRMRRVRQSLIDAGMRRANALGWPNTYTLTKSLAESLLTTRGRGLPIAIVRPSIVESSIEKPFPGWNEGINTSASLSWLLGTYFRQLPTNERKALDVIPVDIVARGMTLIATALVERRHQPVYQLATSVTNPCNMRRSIELTSLAHRKYYRAQNGMSQWLRSRFEAIPVSKARYDNLSAPAQKAVIHALHRTLEPLPFVRTPLARRERDLERVIRMVQLFEPFILHNDHIFEARNIEDLSAAIPPEELDSFSYNARLVDWWDYWINIHIPALRRWSYPLIEGRPLPERGVRGVFHSHGPETAPPGAHRDLSTVSS
jgi:fatty acyl-CoA reductase